MEELDYLDIARFDGPESADFLQAQLTADIGVLQPGDATYACYCSPRGQVFGLLLVRRLEDGFQLVGASELLAGMLNRLRMFVFRCKVEFALDETLSVYGLWPAEYDSAEGAFHPEGSSLKYLVAESGLAAAGKETGFKAMEIINQVTWLSNETTEKFIPQMLGFEQIGAVSYSKGCYPGQEIVARAHYLGKVKRKPDILKVEKELQVPAAERVELRRAGEWLSGTVVDSASDGNGSTQLFVIASAVPEGTTQEFKYQDLTYLCATT